MDHVQHARPFARSGSNQGTSPVLAAPHTVVSDPGDDEPSGEPDSPGPRSTLSGPGADPYAELFFDQSFGALGGFLLGVVMLLVPLTGVVMDRQLLPSHQESSEQRFRPVVVAESPENRGPERTAPDR